MDASTLLLGVQSTVLMTLELEKARETTHASSKATQSIPKRSSWSLPVALAFKSLCQCRSVSQCELVLSHSQTLHSLQ